MPFKTDAVDLIVLLLVAAAFLGLLAYVAFTKSQARRETHNIAAISAALIDYFRRTGVEVSVGCVTLRHDGRFTAFIESEPMKRFRLSHIIEMTLREHVSKACGMQLDKVYWRFPIKNTAQNAAAAGDTVKESKAPNDLDDYINEGLVHYRDLPKVEVTEISWEKFEEVSSKEPDDKAPGPETKTNTSAPRGNNE